jgi:prepilin-type N-terminal cleavage/methylation domain-containing protein
MWNQKLDLRRVLPLCLRRWDPPASKPPPELRRAPSPFCRSPRNRAAGFTLIEVVIGAAVLAIALGSAIVLISQSSRYVGNLQLWSRSSQVLQQRVEELRAMSWSQVTTNVPATFTSAIDTNGTYQGFVNISNYQFYGTNATVVRATVSVTWTNRLNLVVSNQLTTLICNGGINKTDS